MTATADADRPAINDVPSAAPRESRGSRAIEAIAAAAVTGRAEGREPDPADAAERAEAEGLRARTAARVREAVARLPGRRRDAVVARFGLDGSGERGNAAIGPDRHPGANRQMVAAGLACLRRRLVGA